MTEESAQPAAPQRAHGFRLESHHDGVSRSLGVLYLPDGAFGLTWETTRDGEAPLVTHVGLSPIGMDMLAKAVQLVADGRYANPPAEDFASMGDEAP